MPNTVPPIALEPRKLAAAARGIKAMTLKQQRINSILDCILQ